MHDWQPITLDELEAMIVEELSDCSLELQEFFARTRVTPTKWTLPPWGDEGGGFWVVAIHDERALWFNDIEDGFNVSRFVVMGAIPHDEYWCNQDPLQYALPNLAVGASGNFGPPEPVAP
jgi:hypothetical protein